MIMNKIKLIAIVLLPVIFLSGCSFLGIKRLSNEEIQQTINKSQNSKLIIVDIYHTSCETCKNIEPVVENLRKYYAENKDIVFVKYDLSNPFTLVDSMKIAKALGLEAIYKAQRYSGVVLVIDAKSKKVLDTLIAETDINKYASVIKKRLENNAA